MRAVVPEVRPKAFDVALAPGQEVRDVAHRMAPRHKTEYLRSDFTVCKAVCLWLILGRRMDSEFCSVFFCVISSHAINGKLASNKIYRSMGL